MITAFTWLTVLTPCAPSRLGRSTRARGCAALRSCGEECVMTPKRACQHCGCRTPREAGPGTCGLLGASRPSGRVQAPWHTRQKPARVSVTTQGLGTDGSQSFWVWHCAEEDLTAPPISSQGPVPAERLPWCKPLARGKNGLCKEKHAANQGNMLGKRNDSDW